jgi:hypothetical protein
VNICFSFEIDPSPVNLGFMSKSSLVQTTIWDNEKSQFSKWKTTKIVQLWHVFINMHWNNYCKLNTNLGNHAHWPLQSPSIHSRAKHVLLQDPSLMLEKMSLDQGL